MFCGIKDCGLPGALGDKSPQLRKYAYRISCEEPLVDGVPHSVGHQRSTHRSRGLIGWRCFISSFLRSQHCSFNFTAINRALRACSFGFAGGSSASPSRSDRYIESQAAPSARHRISSRSPTNTSDYIRLVQRHTHTLPSSAAAGSPAFSAIFIACTKAFPRSLVTCRSGLSSSGSNPRSWKTFVRIRSWLRV